MANMTYYGARGWMTNFNGTEYPPGKLIFARYVPSRRSLILHEASAG